MFSVDIDNVYENPDNAEDKKTRSSFSTSTLTLRKKGKFMSSWNIDDPFTFRVSAICRLNCDTSRQVEVSFKSN